VKFQVPETFHSGLSPAPFCMLEMLPLLSFADCANANVEIVSEANAIPNTNSTTAEIARGDLFFPLNSIS
jgi:hypothetical protein